MPSKPVLSEKDRNKVREKLLSLCEQLWILQGYKKTSVKELCGNTGIAIGTFYSLFSTKEELFLETAKAIQNRLKEQFLRTVRQGENKDSLAKALKELLREFDGKPFLYDVNTPDFKAFIARLSEGDMEEIKFESIAFFREVCRETRLKPKIDETKAYGILSALLSTVAAKQTLSAMCDYLEVFDFMADHLIMDMFE